MRAPGFVLLLLAACATIQVDGHDLLESDWQQSRAAIVSRASFELKCPAEKLAVRVLSTCPNDIYVCTAGVEGCDQRLVYVRNSGSWVLNSENRNGQQDAAH